MVVVLVGCALEVDDVDDADVGLASERGVDDEAGCIDDELELDPVDEVELEAVDEVGCKVVELVWLLLLVAETPLLPMPSTPLLPPAVAL